MSSQQTFVLEILEISQKSHDFWFSPCFFYEAHCFAMFFNPCAGNAWRAITLFFLFKSTSPLKNKCDFWKKKKKKKIAQCVPHIMPRFFQFPIFVGGAASRGILYSVLLRECRKFFFKNFAKLLRYQLFHYRLFFFFWHRECRAAARAASYPIISNHV